MSEADHEGNGNHTGFRGQGYSERTESFSPNTVVVPTADEIALMTDLKDNLKQTNAYIKELTKDKEDLSETNETCVQLVEDQFAALRQLLTERERFHLDNLNQRFEERDRKLEEQLGALEKHRKENKQCEKDCIQFVGTMPVEDDEQEKARLEKIKSAIDTCIADSPPLQKVPISLKYRFDTETQLKRSMETYGKLVFDRMQKGEELYFSRLNARVVIRKKVERRRGDAALVDEDAKEDILLPQMDRFNVKYDKKIDQFKCEMKISDPPEYVKLNASGVNAYDASKKKNIFVQVQCVSDPNKSGINWDQISIHNDQFLKFSNLALEGSKYIGNLNKSETYKTEHYVVGRARIVYVDNEDEADVGDNDIVEHGPWSAETSAKYRLAVGGANGANGANEANGVNGAEGYMVAAQEEQKSEVVVTSGEIGDLPDKIAIKCDVAAAGTTRNKTVILKKNKNEYNYASLVSKLRAAANVRSLGRDVAAKAEFDVIVAATNDEITNDGQLISNVLQKAIGTDNGKVSLAAKMRE